MNKVDDTLLMSYVDGELDVATSREVEAVLLMQPHLAQQVQRMREDSALLRSAFNHVLHEAPHEAASEILGLRTGRQSLRQRNWRIPLAMAASAVLLACGVLLGHGLGSSTAQSMAVADRGTRDAALQTVLEAHKSGSTLPWSSTQAGTRGQVTAVSTYRNNSGRFCREFEEVSNVDGVAIREAGVACREDSGQWRVRIRYYP